MDQVPDFVIFLGRFHPLLVHLPIGILIIAFMMEFLGRKPTFAHLKSASTFALFWGAISAIAAAFLGWLLSQGGGYNEDTLFWHKWLGIFLALFASFAWAIKKYPKKLPAWSSKALMPVLGLMMLMMVGTGHNGGSLTHGSTYLVQYAPAPIRALAGVEADPGGEMAPIEDIQAAFVFEDIIHPMVKRRCQSCHNEDKKKGKLRLDTREMFVKGGKNGPIFEAGNPEESEIFHRITLPETDDDFMPPEGKTPLTKEQTRLIEWWISEGAPFDKTVAEMNVSEEIQPLLDELSAGDPTKRGIFAMEVPAADPAAMSKLMEKSARAMPIAQGTNFIQVSMLRDSTPFGNEDMKLLLPLAEQITWLDLRNAEIDDYSILSQLPNLTRIHLENTAVSNEDLAHLSQLKHLEYLNLYGTAVNNDGLTHLNSLSQLKSLYLWQTQVDSSGVNMLREAIPELNIDMGWDTLQLKQVSITENF